MKSLNKINDGDDVQEQELLVEDIDSQEQTELISEPKPKKRADTLWVAICFLKMAS